jgi:RNA recognition motif-containing protein
LNFKETKCKELKMNNRLFVGNLPFSVDDSKLKDIFSEYGKVSEAKIIKDKFSDRSKGFGFVTYEEEASAENAISQLDSKEIEGRAIKVSIAKPMDTSERPRRPSNGGGFNRERRSFNRY